MKKDFAWNAPINNSELKQMVQEALKNWIFNDTSDPDGKIKANLVQMSARIYKDDEVKQMFEGYSESISNFAILEYVVSGGKSNINN